MYRLTLVTVVVSSLHALPAMAGDWPAWRGLHDNGYAPEKAVVTSWSPSGEQLLWKSPIGGRTTPIVLGGRVYFNTTSGSGECLRERVVCLDADSGKLLWEHVFNVFLTTIVEDRVAWSAVVADPQTGFVYAHGTGGELFCFDRDGNVRWSTSLTEMFGRISGYGGRLHTPIIDRDHVILAFSNSSWGDQARPQHRLLALDKVSGEVMWWAAPGHSPPIDATCYSTPVVAVIAGRRQLVAANGDGWVYGMDADTGAGLWKFRMSKRGLNSSVAVSGNYIYACHSEENIHTTQMGAVVCIDGSQRGDITQSGLVWRVDDVGVGYASPALANERLYVVDNSANLHAFDARSGKQYWKFNFGRVGKASPVVTADGVIYVAGQTGNFNILRDAGDRCISLDREEFVREDGLVDDAYGCAAVVDGRVFFQTRSATYCLARPGTAVERLPAPPAAVEDAAAYAGRKHLRITPAEITVMSSWEASFYTELFDGPRVMVDPPGVQWSVQGISGSISDEGVFKAEGQAFSAGYVIARVGDLEARARIRYAPRNALSADFEDLEIGKVPPGWVGITGKTRVVERDGGKVLMKLAEKPSVPFTRIRGYITRPLPGGYTVQADILGAPKGKRFKPDMGLINTRYTFMMRGGAQALRLVSWSPEPRIQKDVPFEWQTEVWYTVKFQVQVRDDDALVRAKVWPRGQDEPSAWSIEMADPCPNREGSPGIYGYSTGTTSKSKGTEIFYDNVQVIRHES